ncbi:efflux RND transporter periplasmic adaptor subunit [Cohnella hashimotonis]|uniref:Efflux RND transporter periplasmic adaptor subunit n=1 Tax=Cohnella hashimotonis TaxID=2826895 RepID=A0ABT6TVN0_9BACL|nr:efflux RND transporter periplasmic adaptor subunit [Cohnella hashimotonis]MDI4650004.1 efflux RND transporter periplasmic adaptor subunit [Cohnella hashimotonis]
MSHRYRRMAAAGMVLVLGGALAGCSLLPREEAALAPPLVKPAAENYQTVKAVKGPIDNALQLGGTFESLISDVAQFTGTGGRISKIDVTSGQMVKKGDPLAELVLDDLDLRVKEQEIALLRAKAELKSADKQYGDKQDEDSQSALRVATLQRDIEQMKYDRLRKQLDSKLLYAKIDGQVVFVEDLQPGDYVDAYQTIVKVANLTKMQLVTTGASAEQAGKAEIGFKAEVTFNGADNKEIKFEAKVSQTPASAPQTLNKQLAEKYASTLYFTVPKMPEGAELGQSVSIRIILQHKDDVIKIPRSGLRTTMGRNYVRVLQDGKLREVDVEPGISAPTEVEIVTGLSEGDSVVLQ